jgi:hypothetical protein
VNAAVSNLLQIAVSKNSSKNVSNLQQQISLKLPSDSNKLEKQLKSFISKLENGATLLSNVYKRNGKLNFLFELLIFEIIKVIYIFIIIILRYGWN